MLNLAAAGVQTDQRGAIPVNERLETNVAGVYAIGDVNGGPAFTHISYDDFRILDENLIRGGKRTTEGRLVPYCMFTDPELGHVGLSESQAKDKGLDYRVCKLDMTHVARALEMNETAGFVKAIVDNKSNQLLGFTALCVEGGEIMSMAELAMMGGLTTSQLQSAVFAHPTMSELFNNLFA